MLYMFFAATLCKEEPIHDWQESHSKSTGGFFPISFLQLTAFYRKSFNFEWLGTSGFNEITERFL